MQYLELILLLFWGIVINADDNSDENGSRSSVAYEFSFLLPGNERSCFYQNIAHGARLKFSFEV